MAEVTAVQGGGAALKQAIQVARARAGITSDMQLSIRAGVHYDTLHNWYSGRTTPRPSELAKVARVLDVSLVDLMGAYEGRDPEPPDLVQAVGQLVTAIRTERQERADQIERILLVLASIAAAMPTPARVGTQYPKRERRERPTVAAPRR